MPMPPIVIWAPMKWNRKSERAIRTTNDRTTHKRCILFYFAILGLSHKPKKQTYYVLQSNIGLGIKWINIAMLYCIMQLDLNELFFIWNIRKITKSKYEYVKVVCFSHFCSFFFSKCSRDLFTLFILPAHWSRFGHSDLKSTKRFKTGPELLLGQCCCMLHTWRAFVSSF